jgi:flavin reductase (DIM6/NTAB) family NADH-FMN oxidoreductase RutF
MKKIPLDPQKDAYRLLNPGCVAVISVGNKNEDNLFTVTWNMPIRKVPSMAAILSGKRHYSYPFIEKTGEFGINLLSAKHIKAVYGCGTTSGHKVKDKFEKFGLTREESQQIKAPLIQEAIANLECRVFQVVDMGQSALLMANILSARVSEEFFSNGDWDFDKGLELLHHLGGNRFCTSKELLTVTAQNY